MSVFLSEKKEEQKRKNNAFSVLKNKLKKTTDKKMNPFDLSNNRHKKQTKKISKFWYSAEFLNCYRPISRIITWCLRLRKSHKDTQVPFILEEGPVEFTLNES